MRLEDLDRYSVDFTFAGELPTPAELLKVARLAADRANRANAVSADAPANNGGAVAAVPARSAARQREAPPARPHKRPLPPPSQPQPAVAPPRRPEPAPANACAATRASSQAGDSPAKQRRAEAVRRLAAEVRLGAEHDVSARLQGRAGLADCRVCFSRGIKLESALCPA